VAETGTAMEMTTSLTSGAEPDRICWMIEGRIYQPAPLVCQWKEESCLAGVVALQVARDALVPPALAIALAEYLAHSGDTNPVPWLDW
jgi:hypothetical protein